MAARFFNTAGPVKHYALHSLGRVDLPEILRLIDQEKYFVLHAPRQTGKTSCLLALRDRLNREGCYRCLYANLEAARENVRPAMAAILRELGGRAEEQLGGAYAGLERAALAGDAEHMALNVMLGLLTGAAAAPLVVLLDEVDSLVGDTLVSLLRQIRSGCDRRPAGFPQTVVLCGVRDVRDYRLRADGGKPVVTGGSAFNIRAESLRVGDFTEREIALLYGQHTAETGQPFAGEALGLAWELTRGQPWLVNALAYEVCFRMAEGRDRARPVTAELLQEAKERLVLRRETHLDQLADKLGEERVRRVMGPVLAGKQLPVGLEEDDKDYLIDLGLLRRGPTGLEVANPIYREVIPRQLSGNSQDQFAAQVRTAWFVRPDDRLDVAKLLSAFQEFYREHSEHWLSGVAYREAAPQLLLQAFLQRVVNGGGRVEREYGLGRGRTDLMVLWPVRSGPPAAEGDADWTAGWDGGAGPVARFAPGEEIQRAVVELKVLRRDPERTLAEGLAQTRAYMDRCRAPEGHLLIFDRTSGRNWEERVFRRPTTDGGPPVTVWGV